MWHRHSGRGLRVIAGLALAVGAAFATTVTGTVRLTDSLDPGVRKRKDYSGVVVWLEPAASTQASNSRANGSARMEQRGKRFIPHVLAVQSGEAVEFPNFDPIFHNAFSNFSGQIFDLGLYAPGTTRKITFTRTGIVRVFCNIHPAMSAVIVVVRHPWFAVSGASGAFSIGDVPPGEYVVHVFHERATEQTLNALKRKIAVTAEAATVPPLAISETGYLEAPHRNKYGQDYPPLTDDEAGYGSGRE